MLAGEGWGEGISQARTLKKMRQRGGCSGHAEELRDTQGKAQDEAGGAESSRSR